MGNCIETYMNSQEVEGEQEDAEREETEGGFIKDGGLETSGVRVKIVLTKEELEWLLFQLKGKNGKRLEDVLGEIERERRRGKVVGWKPSLESIMESPELIEMDR